MTELTRNEALASLGDLLGKKVLATAFAHDIPCVQVSGELARRDDTPDRFLIGGAEFNVPDNGFIFQSHENELRVRLSDEAEIRIEEMS